MKRILPELKCKSGNKYGMLLCVIVIVMLCCGCASGSAAQNGPMQSIDTAMGTIISQTIYVEAQAGDSPDGGAINRGSNSIMEDESKIMDDILQIITDLEQNLLSWRLDTSELYTVNAMSGQAEGVGLSGELAEILAECMEVSDASDGAFDITMGETVRLWDIDAWATEKDASDYVRPGEDALRDSITHSGYEKLTLQENRLFLPAKMQLDLGAVGKGIALDWVKEYLSGQGITGAVISVGGSILTYGQKPDGSAWKVGVVNPHDTSQNIGYLTLEGQWCVSTSGDYERFVEVDGVRYHHIIDPATGYPADSGLSSVTILTEDGLLSDALSTACFILGPEKGRDLVKQFGAEALFVDKEGNITMTAGMEQYFN